MEKEKTAKKTVSKKTVSLAHGVGRRKSSVARVWLKKGSGSIIVNNKPIDEYFDTEITRYSAKVPMSLCAEVSSKCDFKVNIFGGGKCSQSGAVRLGISRALVKLDPDLRPTLKKNKLLTVDARVKERKKYGQRGARRKFQFVKR